MNAISAGDNISDDLDLFGVASAILRHMRIVAGVPVAIIILVVGWSALMPRRYTVGVVFTPSSQSSPVSQLVGLAAQFGLTGGAGGDASDSPDFYSDFIQSDELLHAVVTAPYQYLRDGTPVVGDLIGALEVDSAPPGIMEARAVVRLRGQISTRVDPKTGTVSLSVWTKDPALSLQVVQRILDEVNHFNRQVRQNQAGQERRFIGVRLDSALAELRLVQDQMQSFLQRNRDFANSPQLQFQYNRIQQELTTRQTLYASLLQGYEQARMEEVRSTPIVTVVEQPMLPVQPDRRHLGMRGLLSLVLGSLLGAIAALGADRLDRRRRDAPAAAAELRALWERRRAQVMAPVRAVLRRRWHR